MKKIWTEERETLLRRLYPDAHLGSLAARLGVSVVAVRSRAKLLGLKRKRPRQKWTSRQISYLKKHYADTPIEVLIVKTKHPPRSIWAKARKLGLYKSKEFLAEIGRNCSLSPRSVAHRFVKGQPATNKGKRQHEFMSADGIKRSSRTRFKPGHIPHNTRAVGTDCLHADGYVYIKLEHGTMPKHRYIWEQHHGKVPQGMMIAFIDGDRQNCAIENLKLINRQENCRRRTAEETPEARAARLAKAQESRNKSIRRDRLRLHWGLQPIGKLIKRW